MGNDEFLGVEIPEDSILRKRDYKSMYDIATRGKNIEVLRFIASVGEVSLIQIQTRYPDGGHRVRELNEIGLVQKRLSGNYRVSSLGDVVAQYGVKEGIRELIRRESEYTDAYNGLTTHK